MKLRLEFAPPPCVRCPGDGVVRPAANRVGIDWPVRCSCRGGKPYTQYELGRILKEDPEAIVRVHELRAGSAVSRFVFLRSWMRQVCLNTASLSRGWEVRVGEWDECKDDVDRVIEIARRYDVTLFLADGFSSSNTRGLQHAKRSKLSRGGPLGHYCDPYAASVWFERLDVEEVHVLLHEVVHCIVQPPTLQIDEVPEDLFLMPFERVLARQTMTPASYARVVDWQETTQIEWHDKRTGKFYGALEEVPNYTRRSNWRESHDALRRMGAIANGRVTWRLPNWKRVPKAIMKRCEGW